MLNITKNIKDLNFKCSKVESYSEGYKIGLKLQNTLLFKGLKNSAVGLAHNQIKGNKQVYITNYKNKFRVFINPTIINKSENFINHKEGCLSYKKGNTVIRYNWVIIKHLTKNGYKQEKFEGFEGCIHQHEYDHLQGIDIHHKPINQ